VWATMETQYLIGGWRQRCIKAHYLRHAMRRLTTGHDPTPVAPGLLGIRPPTQPPATADGSPKEDARQCRHCVYQHCAFLVSSVVMA
jgi:hypothetical protein